jgi:hypothetical protein
MGRGRHRHVPAGSGPWELLWNRLTTLWGAVTALGVAGLFLWAVWHIARVDPEPGTDAMATFAAVDVGLLIGLSIEQGLDGSVDARRTAVAGRTIPVSFALLLGLLGATGHPTGAVARWIAALAFALTALGVLSVIFSAMDRADKART